ncbi:hypothetical protein D9Q98_007548 [Chlorella vulgaris]|uniref:serine O-acetyltransferase n=1 Tax=Chlorella vulgaris TaxID=3077 RepID=A0A9D4TLC3_CHLVU|nr:hypothetical protein D9Q98_007548 [Chlorella vulgaris]
MAASPAFSIPATAARLAALPPAAAAPGRIYARPSMRPPLAAAVAADRELGSGSTSPKGWQDGSSLHSRPARVAGAEHSVNTIRAARFAQRLNEEMWHRQLAGDLLEAVPRVEAAEALAHNKWEPSSSTLTQQQLWEVIRHDAREVAASEPVLASFSHMTVIMHSGLDRSLAFILANKLQSSTLLGTQLTRLFVEAYEDDPSLVEAAVADLQAVVERDPACDSHVQPLLFFKGFQALQAHRVAHWMWARGRKSLAVALQSRMSEVFGVDIHPAATLGWGIMMDHATGIVIGETAVVGDNVSMLHHVTLGGSGTGTGMRHPVVGNGVLLGAGVSVLGPVVVGHCSKIGAGSVVATDLPPHVVAVGVPAKVIKRLDEFEEPVKMMDQVSGFILDFII